MSSPQWLTQLVDRVVPRGSGVLVPLVAVTLAAGLGIWFQPHVVPLVVLVVPLVVASLVLGPRQLPWFVVFVLFVLAVVTPKQDIDVRVAVAVTVIFSLGLMILLASLRRSRLGVAGLQGETMFVDLRDRILRQGGIPDLPDDWYAASELRSAGGTPFAGDFVVASRVDGRLEVAVVDVSGKGQGAGTRALLLCGAIGGLLSALPPSEFLAGANRFLLRQDWDEGFATAIHLSLDLATGRFDIRSAGHPPAALRHAGSGRWEVLGAEGPILGLLEDADFPPTSGEMRRGDALLLYTDGMVETRTRDISLGIDRMLGQAEHLLRGRFEGGATRLVEALGSRNDDRALLLVHRR
ncbi:PP2C family protein-serine/threonine phosphatase [Nocardioides xinjiangensis]|uniref:PP2C family protein-serine/threonine phosphatase n=1 Tax=Nocardioides xinjiangensis TaxID=2817376 RepID=UPI001B3175F9|nr:MULTISPECIES: PP2C family protein-serine/threonine phosphatase [unclassified Nocardioides]